VVEVEYTPSCDKYRWGPWLHLKEPICHFHFLSSKKNTKTTRFYRSYMELLSIYSSPTQNLHIVITSFHSIYIWITVLKPHILTLNGLGQCLLMMYIFLIET